MNPLNLLDLGRLKTLAIVFVVAALAGFAGGYQLKARFDRADQAKALATTVHSATQAVVAAHETSTVIESHADAAKTQVSSIRKQVAHRLTQQEKTHEQASLSSPPSTPSGAELRAPNAVDGWIIDAGTVRLLNAARTGESVDPAGGSDAASQAPSGVSPAQLIDNDLEVVEMYRDLAIRHNALVDWVESVIKEQNK